MIEITQGDLLQANVTALVNAVNTVGIMGKGIALQFKQVYPENFKAYAKACKQEQVQIGQVFIVDLGLLSNPRYIINFPTKKHWRSPSKLEYIQEGLVDLLLKVRELSIESLALPALGVGNGSLEWTEVHPVIAQAFAALPEVRVLMYEPQ